MATAGALGKIDFRAPDDPTLETKKLNVYEDAMAAVTSWGLTTPKPMMNGYNGGLPNDLTALDDESLGDLLSNLSQYIGYVESRLAQSDVNKGESESHLEFVKSKIRLGLRAAIGEGRVTAQDKTDAMVADERFKEAEKRAQYCDAIYKITKNIRDTAQRNWETVSRQITLRGQGVERMRREGNVVGVPVMGNRFKRPGS